MTTPQVTPPSTPKLTRAHGATIPLASTGMSPEQHELMNRLAQAPQNVAPPRVVTQAQYEGEVARKISQDAERARQAAIRSGQTYKTAQKEMEKLASEAKQSGQAHAYLCTRMQEYKKLFEGKIPFKFRPVYDANRIKPEEIESEVKQVEVVLNTRHAPQRSKEAFL